MRPCVVLNWMVEVSGNCVLLPIASTADDIYLTTIDFIDTSKDVKIEYSRAIVQSVVVSLRTDKDVDLTSVYNYQQVKMLLMKYIVAKYAASEKKYNTKINHKLYNIQNCRFEDGFVTHSDTAANSLVHYHYISNYCF